MLQKSGQRGEEYLGSAGQIDVFFTIARPQWVVGQGLIKIFQGFDLLGRFCVCQTILEAWVLKHFLQRVLEPDRSKRHIVKKKCKWSIQSKPFGCTSYPELAWTKTNLALCSRRTLASPPLLASLIMWVKKRSLTKPGDAKRTHLTTSNLTCLRMLRMISSKNLFRALSCCETPLLCFLHF